MLIRYWLVGLVAVTFCNADAHTAKGSPDDTAVVRAAISAQERLFADCMAKRDAACVVNSFYVSDKLGPIASEPGGPPIRGRAALIKTFDGMFDQVKTVEFETDELIVRGTMAVQFGRVFATTLDGKDSVNRFSVVWLREKGHWRAKLDFLASAEGWPR